MMWPSSVGWAAIRSTDARSHEFLCSHCVIFAAPARAFDSL